ncbi:PQQ-binding-like beta-propeller repeat protein [uncultured Sphingomonas sp.]|uniref:PQQ-like beta-propeller repeat protein n=1 Tax=uncultured Sphingomonas sp. TaxID=158754 RepID=UPI0025CCB620|nr:PQQ-binding-like beta-propeller repeat protein [uncultured Sphingomonas sp.]
MNKRVVVALALTATLSGCGIFKGGGERGPKTAVLGERIPILSTSTDTVADPGLADVPVVVPPAVANDSWTQPGGSAAKNLGNVALGASPRQVWSAAIPGGDITKRIGSTPAVAGGRLYVISADAVVHAFDAKTGGRLWQAALGGGKKDRSVLFGGGVSVDGERVFATTGRGDAAALDVKTGKVLWKVRPAGPLRGAPAIGGGNIYVLTQDNQILALKPDNGETVWTVSATLQGAGVFGVAAPAFAQGTVVAGFSSGELSALRYENGRIVWQDQLSRTSITTSVSTISDIDAAPVIAEGKVYAIGQGGRMVGMDLVNGQRLWELSIGGISMPWLAGEWLFVVTDDAKLMCIARTTGKIRWVTQLAGFRDPKKRNKPVAWYGPVLAGGRLMLVNSIGQMQPVAPDTGKAAEPTKAGKQFYLPPVVADNMLYLIDGKGRITGWR